MTTNSFTGKSYWVFQKNIPSTDWIPGFVLHQEKTLLNKKTEQTNSIISVVFATFAFLFSLCLLFVSIYRYDQRGLWTLAVSFSLLCILGIGFMWHLTMNNSSLDGRNGDLAVFDREDLWIRVLSNKSAGNVLVPDFNSYNSLIPESLPGLEPSILLGVVETSKNIFQLHG